MNKNVVIAKNAKSISDAAIANCPLFRDVAAHQKRKDGIMKNLTIAFLAASSLTMVASPALARTGQVVNFSYFAKELASEQSRTVMLKRMKAATRAACKGNKAAAYSTSKECAQDLEEQFITAISHPQLIAQYEGKPMVIAHNGQ